MVSSKASGVPWRMTPPMKNSTNQAKPRAPPRRHQAVAPPLVVGLLTDISFTPCVPSKVVPSFMGSHSSLLSYQALKVQASRYKNCLAPTQFAFRLAHRES